jgi:hypothetical protein
MVLPVPIKGRTMVLFRGSPALSRNYASTFLSTGEPLGLHYKDLPGS